MNMKNRTRNINTVRGVRRSLLITIFIGFIDNYIDVIRFRSAHKVERQSSSALQLGRYIIYQKQGGLLEQSQ